MSTECQGQLEEELVRSSRDYRLNTRLRLACQPEVERLCMPLPSACTDQGCNGAVLRCLRDK